MDSSSYVDEEIVNIYNRQFSTVYRICYSFMKNVQDAEDMAQETFLKLISCQKQFESEEHEKAWLIVTASNTCKDELRQWKRRLENVKNLFRQEGFSHKEDSKVGEWVMELPVRYKQVIYLYYYEGYHTSEIANMLHCPESTVRNRLLRGRKLLKKNSTGHVRTVALLTAVLVGSLFVATTAYAVYLYKLRDLHLGKENVLDLSERKEMSGEIMEEDIPTKEADKISLAGIVGSPEYKACEEWCRFLDAYDADGTIFSEVGNGFAGLGEYEQIYGCYTQEMVDKVDELCCKYGLSRLQGFSFAENYEDLCRQTCIGEICKGVDGQVRWDIDSGYLYDDGTFGMEGRVAWKDSLLYVTDFQLECTRKGFFQPVTLNIGDIEAYHEWNVTGKDGQEMLLANSGEKALIIVEKKDFFIVINVLGKMPENSFAISDEMLESLAAVFDFSKIP